jgi:hypothetical protein
VWPMTNSPQMGKYMACPRAGGRNSWHSARGGWQSVGPPRVFVSSRPRLLSPYAVRVSYCRCALSSMLSLTFPSNPTISPLPQTVFGFDKATCLTNLCTTLVLRVLIRHVHSFDEVMHNVLFMQLREGEGN